MKKNIWSRPRAFVTLCVVALVATSVAAPALGQDELTTEERKAIVSRISAVMNEHYFDVGVAHQMGEALQRALETESYKNFKTLPRFCRQLTEDLRSVSHDLHLEVHPYRGGPIEQGEPDEATYIRQNLSKWKKANFGFQKVELLAGNIGYLDLRGFYLTRVAGPTAIGAMNLLAHCDALIIDLRSNRGGQPSMIRLLCSYFLEKRTNLGSLYRRDQEIADQSWTSEHVQGSRLTDQPIYILVSETTMSAAEAFAYSLKHLGRATIVGETTAGAANPMASYDFPGESITINVPYGKVINPITKENWEGKGVIPDIPAPAKDALEVARLEALKVLRDKEEDENARVAFEMMIAEAETRLNPVSLENDALLPFTGSYERGIEATIEKGFLNVLGYILVPMGNDKFMIENGEEQVQFNRSTNGEITEFVVMFRDGRRMAFKRVEE